MRTAVTGLFAAGFAGLLTVFSAVNAAVPAPRSPDRTERFVAFAVDPSTACPSRCGPVDITITRWTTPAERRALVDQLLAGGPNAWIDALGDTEPVGYLQTLYSAAYELRFAQAIADGDGGRHIVLAADRPVTFWQLWNRPMSSRLPFTVIELHVDRAGEGEGRLWVPGRVAGNREADTIEIEGRSEDAVLLTNVRTVKAGT